MGHEQGFSGWWARAKVDLGRFSESSLEQILLQSSSITDIGSRISFLSDCFLGIDYRESTLIGGPESEEVLVVDLRGMDCFTFLDYVEAMRRSRCLDEFPEILLDVRYRDGVLSYAGRNHFFTDWLDSGSSAVEDVTGAVGGPECGEVTKVLNRSGDGRPLLAGVALHERLIRWIPSRVIDEKFLERLRTGDYIGIFTPLEGMDVTHVGIFLRREGNSYFRHASSAAGVRRVTDEDFLKYVGDKPGIVVLRPYARE